MHTNSRFPRFDNSGQRTGDPFWGSDQGSMDHTLQVLQVIGEQLGNKVSVIELLNEVAGFRSQQWADAARAFWQTGYDRIRAAAGNNVKIMIGDAFLGLDSWYGYMKSSQGVMMDLVSSILCFIFESGLMLIRVACLSDLQL